MTLSIEQLSVSPVSVDVEASLEDVARAFEQTEGRQLPVFSEGAPVGVVRREDLADQGMLRDGIWIQWGEEAHARGLVQPVPVIDAADPGARERALSALLDHPCALIRIADDVFAILTEHDGVRIAVEQAPSDILAIAVASAPPRTIEFDKPAICAVRNMGWHHTRHLLLMEDERLIGVISERDLASEGISSGRELTVGEVWRERPLIAATDEAGLTEVAMQMLDHHIGCVPIVDGEGKPVAVLTRRDLVRFAAGGSKERRATER
jgi:CBS domain-containing protein